MLVYGDPQFSCDLATVAGLLFEQLPQEGKLPSPDIARELLVRAGQLEQAVEDAAERDCFPESTVVRVRAVTDLAADVFLYSLGRSREETPATRMLNSLRMQLSALSEEHPSTALSVKVPEGFQFYALFPEQYIRAASRWLADHHPTPPEPVIVVGIRSIGTTLSALVHAVLKRASVKSFRCTVRPKGHPFDRETDISGSIVQEARSALIVDEGPGLSGSSMASVARVLAGSGISHLAFLPGHAGQPGSAAAKWAKEVWSVTPRYTASPESLRWDGLSLEENLANFARQRGVTGGTVADVSSGAWRKYAYDGYYDWPACTLPFERRKFLHVNESGPALLWKFTGFAASSEAEFAHKPPAAFPHDLREFVTPNLLSCSGFDGCNWTAGVRLRRPDFEERAVYAAIARYISVSSHVPLSSNELQAGQKRLAMMLRVNAQELLGDQSAGKADALISRAQTADCAGFSYGDGRMAPHEWIRSGPVGITKTDAQGHVSDDTVVGPQPVWWDVAGTMVEWKSGVKTAPFLVELRALGLSASQDLLRFYAAAYAAFRVGIMSLTRQQVTEPAEQRRLDKAIADYSLALQAFLW